MCFGIAKGGGLRLNSEFWYFRWFMWIQFYFHSNVLNRVESETQRNKKGLSRNNRRKLLLPSSGGMALLPCRRTRSHLSGNFSLCPLLSLKTFAEGMKKERRPHASIGGVYTHRYTGNNWWMADIRVICLQSWTACCVEWTRNKREEKGRKRGEAPSSSVGCCWRSSSARSIVRLLMSGGRCQKGQVRCPACTTQLPVHI